MQVLSVRCGLTKNLGNYESAKLEVEAAPSDGQTADQLLAEVNDYLNKQVESLPTSDGNGKTAKKSAAKKSDPPLRGGGKSGEKAVASGEPGDSAPFDVDSAPNAEPGGSPAKKRGRTKSGKAEPQATTNPASKPAAELDPIETARREYRYTLEAETLEELLERFNGLRGMAVHIGDRWEATVEKVKERYRKLNSLDANKETLAELVKAFKAEDAAVQKMLSEAA